MNKYVDYYPSPLGLIKMTSDEEGLTSLLFVDSKDEQTNPSRYTNDGKEWLYYYFRGEETHFIPSLSLHGTEFQNRVWESIVLIPFGETRTYKEVADEIAHERGKEKMSPQAVGHALSQNQILLVVPCHRIIGSDGSLVGYRGGLELKKKLLDFEKNKHF